MSQWKKHHDEQYQAPYWHNAATNQSSWTDPNPSPKKINTSNPKSSVVGASSSGAYGYHDTDADFDADMIADFRDADGGSSAETTGLLSTMHMQPQPRGSDHDRVSLILDRDRVYADTEMDIRRYSRSLYITACIIEAPGAVLEGLGRIVWCCVAALVFALLAVLRWRHQRTLFLENGRACMREAALCFAAVLSMCVPGLSAFVYRRQDGEGEWDLAPLPTVLGWVDARRFASFSLVGGGRLAMWEEEEGDTNSGDGAGGTALTSLGLDIDGVGGVDGGAGSDSSSSDRRRGRADRDTTSRMALQTATDDVVDILSDLHLPKRLCQDSWTGPIYFYPRKLHRRMQEILKGESERRIEGVIARNSRQQEQGHERQVKTKGKKKSSRSKEPVPV